MSELSIWKTRWLSLGKTKFRWHRVNAYPAVNNAALRVSQEHLIRLCKESTGNKIQALALGKDIVLTVESPQFLSQAPAILMRPCSKDEFLLCEASGDIFPEPRRARPRSGEVYIP